MVQPSRFQNRAVQIVARLQLPGNSSEDSNFPVLVGIRPAGGLDLQHLAGAADAATTAGRRQLSVIKEGLQRPSRCAHQGARPLLVIAGTTHIALSELPHDIDPTVATLAHFSASTSHSMRSLDHRPEFARTQESQDHAQARLRPPASPLRRH
ncbi:hypothetical protein VC279_05850 [Xanthomonas sp. WHRI 10064A]|uniref:hypothetical protein n=1 Tax=unclassified Xanthomonas TaxID=2643310 RepID=UPI002B23E126|nr:MULTISPECIES: hypothetical protein [unclassified Xanthomonas]MEA9585838.1 hypothetical protein [Xanthomonas sp. WHRI 10064B]MEA9614265.1 hypothetical protein [Xanthomonas sp. WHRI 10064A]